VDEKSQVTSSGWSGTPDKYKIDLALLRTLLAVAASSPELLPVLNQVLRTILESLGEGFGGMVLLSDRKHPGLEMVVHQGLSAQDAPRRIYVDACPCGQVMETGLPAFDPDCLAHNCRVAVAGEGPYSWLIVPLKSRQSAFGVLCLACPSDFRMEVSDLSFWEDVGILIGRAVEESWLQAQLQQEQELLQTFYDISNDLASSLDLDWVLSRVLELSIVATGARDGSIFLVSDPDAPGARILRRALLPAEAEHVIEQVLSQGVAGWVVRNEESIIIADTSQDPKWLSFSDDPNPSGSALAVPLMAGGQVLGVLTLDHPETEHFHSKHMAMMQAIAHQASVAIEKARLHKEVARWAEVLAQKVEERTRELRETQAQLIQAEKLAALGELAAGVAHEINNPLHVLQAYVEYLASRALPDDSMLEFVEPMHNALESIARLAGQLRDFSRPASGEWKPIDVNKSVISVLRLVSKELMLCQIEMEELLEPDLPPVRGDARQLEQVFLNLILNARDAMPGGGRLRVETAADTDTVYVRFEDTGVGIQRENLARIFEPYFTTKDDRGTGLGLAICDRIISQQGGKITVSSKVGQGTTFVIHLMVRSRDLPNSE
jgi:two-component system NtrC family sensor kinase